MILAFAYVPVLTKTLPYLITLAAGEQFQQDFRMWTDRSYGRRECGYQLIGGPMGEIFSSHLCVSEEAYYRFPDLQVTVGVVGRRGPLGMSVDRIGSIEPVAQP